MHTLFYFWIIVAFPVLGQAQETMSIGMPDSLRLRVTFPTDGDTIRFDRVRYSGVTHTRATVQVQGEATRVYPSGAFVGMVDLQPGHNQIVFAAEDSLGFISDTLRVFSEPPPKPLPPRPTTIRTEGVQPEEDLWISPGDVLEVEFVGSPGGHATFSLDKIVKNVPMRETRSKGTYIGSVIIPALENYKPRTVEYTLRGADGRRVKARSAGRVHILTPSLPLIGLTGDSLNLVYTEPNGEIWMELPRDIPVQVIGQRGGFSRVRFAENVEGYMSTSTLKTVPFTPLPEASIGSISTLWDQDWVQVRINVSERVPFRFEQVVEGSALEVTFYRARQASQWIRFPKDDETIRSIRWRQEASDRFVLRIELNQQQQWGFFGRYVGRQFWLNIRKTPPLGSDPAGVLSGLTITVDPGHGGEFEGAVSPTGLFEKDVNLRISQRVAELLRLEGANVLMTRMQDTTVSLQSRMNMARAANSHIFVSLHNNSIGVATNPTRPRGTMVFHTVPQSEAIARSVYRRLLELGLPEFGRVASTYFVTRQTGLLSFLVEGLFMTHPEDEMLLLDATFLDEMADAVVSGIKDFVLEQLPPEKRRATDGRSPAQPDTTLRFN